MVDKRWGKRWQIFLKALGEGEPLRGVEGDFFEQKLLSTMNDENSTNFFMDKKGD